jgi:hypothetical protein
MCDVKGKHFFLFELVQLYSSVIIIPIFFFMHNSTLNARCLEIDQNILTPDGHGVKITIPKSLSFDDKKLTSIDVVSFVYETLKFMNINRGTSTVLIDYLRMKLLSVHLLNKKLSPHSFIINTFDIQK